MSRQALGKGLGALLPTSDADTVKKIPLDQIIANPYQPRQNFDDDALNELAESIKTHGILQPILLRKASNGYELVAGERRWRAAKIAGLTEIPALIKELDDLRMSQMALIENLQRDDLNAIEEAQAYQNLLEKFAMTQEEVANAVGKSRVAVTNTLRLLKLSAYVKENVSRETLTPGHARTLLALNDEKIQNDICKKIITEGWSVRQTEDYVRKLLEGTKQKKDKQKKKNIFLDDLSEKIGEQLGTRVNIKPGKKVSKIEIEYYDDDDLERIINFLGIEE